MNPHYEPGHRDKDIQEARTAFQQQKYTILRDFISQEMVSFLYQYGHMRRKVAMTLIKTGMQTGQSHYRPNTDGTFMDKQAPGTYSAYSDLAMETLLQMTLPRLNDVLGLSLVPTYTYWRLYKTGDVLVKHKDRPSCEVSATLCVGYDNGDEENYNWPIFMNSSQEADQPGSSCQLYPGDLVVYRGCEVEHWREAFEGKFHMQAFMHFNEANGVFSELCQYDSRPHLGLPASFRDAEKQAKVKEMDKALKR